MQEIWKDIPWYENYYMVSNFWNIKSLQYRNIYAVNRRDKIMKKQRNVKWYEVIFFSVNWKKEQYLVSRIVASAFLWLSLEYKWHNKSMAVCHKDDNPLNNRVDNLFLATQNDNMYDCIKKWRQRTKWHIPSNRKTILQYDKNMNLIKEWEWSVKIYKELWILSQSILRVCRLHDKNYTAGWFIWRFK